MSRVGHAVFAPVRVVAAELFDEPTAASAGTLVHRWPMPYCTWEDISARAPTLAETMTWYLDQIRVSSRPSTVGAASLTLRLFAWHLAEMDPSCVAAASIERRHIEGYKLALAARPGKGGGPLSVTTIRHNLGMLRTFLERIIDWDHPDAPRRVPIYPGDFPKADEPLPRFLDDPTAAKFMATLAQDPNRRRRLMVELLARTGMRVGELCALQDDAMFKMDGAFWLRVPVGKLHNDRTVPLHPVLVELIDRYQHWRGLSPSGLMVVRDDGRAFDRRTVHRYVTAVARRAGLTVHPHQLRHTLATQCINRGMSLEAIAALLGHRSPRMTLIYARISDDTLAEQYFRATHAVEADAGATPNPERRQTETTSQAQLHRRLLGNGHCTRPVALDCSFQTICESCGFFQTDAEFIPILRRQQQNAEQVADPKRQRIFAELLHHLGDDPNS